MSSALWLLLAVIILIIIELSMGRDAVPKHLRLWGGAKDSSRQLFDWYSPSHIIHGLLFYWLTGNLIIATAIETVWEILENSPFVINRYRKTSSADYEGDTVINSVSDVFCMLGGFYFAFSFPWYASVGTTIFFELLTLLIIRDNLTLNVVMLIHPFERIKRWQMGSQS